jgi:hypothetical protein
MLRLPLNPESFRRFIAIAVRDPLTHFLGIGLVLLIGSNLMLSWIRPEVQVTAAQVDLVQKEFEAQRRRPATPLERTRLMEDLLTDELLAREAIAVGLAQDNRVRTLLAKLMRTSLEPVLPEPTDAQLQAVRAENAEDYRYPARLAFEYAGFRTGAAIPEGFLGRLRAGEVGRSGQEVVGIPNPNPPTWLPELERILGEEAAQKIAGLTPGIWEGPLVSSRGILFVRVLRIEPETEMSFSQIRSVLAEKWREKQVRAEVKKVAAGLRQKYRISLPPVDSPAPVSAPAR